MIGATLFVFVPFVPILPGLLPLSRFVDNELWYTGRVDTARVVSRFKCSIEPQNK